MNADQVGGIVRAILAAIGGYFVGKGLVDSATMTTIVGAAATIAAAVWSAWTNKPGTAIPPKA
jgi:hypothetical protein